MAGLLLVLRCFARRVQGVDLVGVVCQDAAALELEGGCHVAVFHGEGSVDDAVAADRLSAGNGLVGAGDRLLERVAHLGQVRGSCRFKLNHASQDQLKSRASTLCEHCAKRLLVKMDCKVQT